MKYESGLPTHIPFLQDLGESKTITRMDMKLSNMGTDKHENLILIDVGGVGGVKSSCAP